MEHTQPSVEEFSNGTDKEAYTYPTPKQGRAEDRVCGMATRTFFIALLLALLILGGSLAGGLAGGLSARSKKNIVVSPAV
jgi:hypothetical protein